MRDVYLLKNQRHEFLDKSGEWVKLREAKGLYHTVHKDEALNRKVELSVKDFDLRVTISEAKVDGRNQFCLEEQDLEEQDLEEQATHLTDQGTSSGIDMLSTSTDKTQALGDPACDGQIL